MKIRNQYFLFFTILGVMAILLIVNSYWVKNDLLKNTKFTCGIYDNYYETSKGISNNCFHFYFQGNKIYSSTGGKYFYNEENLQYGKCYLVKFSSKNPDNNVMLFDKPCNCDTIKNKI